MNPITAINDFVVKVRPEYSLSPIAFDGGEGWGEGSGSRARDGAGT